MPPFGPIARRDLIAALRSYGFEGPYGSGKHPCMVRGNQRLIVPNPHQGDIGIEAWAHRIREEGYTVFDLGAPPGTDAGPFYGMERRVLYDE